MNVLIDTNIILDFLLQRDPFFLDTERLFQRIDAGDVVGYATATTLTDIFYIARRQTGSLNLARQAIADILTALVICPVDRVVLETALTIGINDFEDAVQIACALAQNLDAIVTRDSRLLHPSIPTRTVQDILTP